MTNNPTQALLNLYKVDNSRATTDKLAEALEVAVGGFDAVFNDTKWLNANNAAEYKEHVNDILYNSLQQIQAIAEKA